MKSIQTKIPIQKPLKTTIIDSTIEYSRILFDIFPSEVGVSLIIGDHKPQIVNDWNEEQQSFIYVCYLPTTSFLITCLSCRWENNLVNLKII